MAEIALAYPVELELVNTSVRKRYELELQSDYYDTSKLHLFASLGLLKSKFDEYDDPNPKNLDTNGREPAQSPKYQYNLGFDYMINPNLKFKTDVEGKESYYFSNRHNEKAKAYALLNTSLTYISDDDWSVSFWGGKTLQTKNMKQEGSELLETIQQMDMKHKDILNKEVLEHLVQL